MIKITIMGKCVFEVSQLGKKREVEVGMGSVLAIFRDSFENYEPVLTILDESSVLIIFHYCL